MLKLVTVNPENWRLGLSVSDEQKNFVSNDMRILARAYAYRESRSNAFVIYDDDTPIGMALYYDCEPLNAYDLSQLFIDARYQGKGYGTQATKQILDLMLHDGKYDKVILCYIEGNEKAKQLYQKFGFYLTGEQDGNEIIMEKRLR